MLFADTGTLEEESDPRRGQERKGDAQARVKATGKRRTRVSEGGLCRRVIFLLEDEANDISRIGIL